MQPITQSVSVVGNIWIHSRRPMSHPYGWAMGPVLWVTWRWIVTLHQDLVVPVIQAGSEDLSLRHTAVVLRPPEWPEWCPRAQDPPRRHGSSGGCQPHGPDACNNTDNSVDMWKYSETPLKGPPVKVVVLEGRSLIRGNMNMIYKGRATEITHFFAFSVRQPWLL